jgi:hypothetical protein
MGEGDLLQSLLLIEAAFLPRHGHVPNTSLQNSSASSILVSPMRAGVRLVHNVAP